jgi:hypothetical protein
MSGCAFSDHREASFVFLRTCGLRRTGPRLSRDVQAKAGWPDLTTARLWQPARSG